MPAQPLARQPSLRAALEGHLRLHRERFLDDLATLVAVDSAAGEPAPGQPYGPGPAAALEAALSIARRLGLHAEDWEGHVGVVTLDGRPERQLDVLAHLDTVPAGSGWTRTEPTRLLLDGGRVYGRGTADDKGPALAALYALAAVRDLGIPAPGGVRVVLGCDEESGSRDLAHYYGRTEHAPMTFTPDAYFPVTTVEKGGAGIEVRSGAVAAAPPPRVRRLVAGAAANVVPATAEVELEGVETDLLDRALAQVTSATGVRCGRDDAVGGVVAVRLTGTGAHASTPEAGTNALTAALELLALLPLSAGPAHQRLLALRALVPHGDLLGRAAGVAVADEESGPLTLALTTMRLSLDGWVAELDCRTPVCADRTTLDPLVERLRAAGAHCVAEHYPAHAVPAGSPFVRTLLEVYEEHTGEPGRCVAIGGGTYVHRVPNGVGFGCALPGTDNRMHGPDEFAEVDVLLRSAAMFAAVIGRLCA